MNGVTNLAIIDPQSRNLFAIYTQPVLTFDLNFSLSDLRILTFQTLDLSFSLSDLRTLT